MARKSVAGPKRPHRAGTDEVGVRHVSDRGNPRPLAEYPPHTSRSNQFPHKFTMEPAAAEQTTAIADADAAAACSGILLATQVRCGARACVRAVVLVKLKRLPTRAGRHHGCWLGWLTAIACRVVDRMPTRARPVPCS